MEIKKNPKSNLENFSGVFTLLGLVLALFIVHVSIEHKTYDRVVEELESVTLAADEVEEQIVLQQLPPQSPPPPPPPPPPPSPDQFKKVEDEAVIEEVIPETTEEEPEEEVEIEEIEYSDESEGVTYEDVGFMAISEAPIYPGCEKYKSASKRKACFSKKVNKFIQRKFDAGLVQELDLPPGVVRMNAFFKIDIYGKVSDIRVRAPKPELKAEFEQTIKKLPQMTPASQNGKKVNLLFALPLMLRVE